MLFNSLQFAVFFAIVYCLYLVLDHKWQNRLLLVASYVFYGAWDWRFLSLIFISTVLDYVCGMRIHEARSRTVKKLFLAASIAGNLSILGFFKYFNFFAGNLQALLGYFGLTVHPHLLHIVLPVGISFYTFQTMSYSLDIYRGEMAPTRKFPEFALFVAFFPQLVAGPIERAKHLLPQMLEPRKITLAKFYDGFYLVFWGLFMKVFAADNLARVVDPVFAAAPPYNGARVLLASYAFVLQGFCDFAGYSNMARGLGKMMGFDIVVNFNIPLLATNIRDFWRKWHISLSSWLRDYLYISLGGSRRGSLRTYRNLIVTMVAVGFWHGAAWNFIIFGLFEGMALVLYHLAAPALGKVRSPRGRTGRTAWMVMRILFMFQVTSLGFLFFRAESVAQIGQMLRGLICDLSFSVPGIKGMALRTVFFSWIVIAVQIAQYRGGDLMAVMRARVPVKALFYFVCFYLLLVFGVTGGKEFVYFQF